MSKQLATVDELKNTITKMKPQFKSALPKHVSADKFARTLMTAVSTNNMLAQADRTSLFAACMTLASQGLLPDGRESAIVTFRNKQGGTTCQAMPMLAGILKKIRNSGELLSIAAHLVHDGDEFSFWIDEGGEHIKHTPNLKGDRGDMTHVYAIAKTKDGGVYIEVMSKKEIEQVRNASRAKDGGPWTQWYGEMARKTALRRLSKRLPMSTDLVDFMQTDDAMTDLEAPAPEQQPESVREEKVVSKKSKPKKLAEALGTDETEIIETQATETPQVEDTELPI